MTGNRSGEICGLEGRCHPHSADPEDLAHELHICEKCAQEKGLIPEEESELPIARLLSGTLEGRDLTGAGQVKEPARAAG